MQAELATLAAIAAGDAAAFGQWVASAEDPVRRGLRVFAASVDTEAVVQEAFLRVWQVAPRFTHDGKPNALLGTREIDQYCATDREGDQLLRHALARLLLSARAYHRVLRVAHENGQTLLTLTT